MTVFPGPMTDTISSREDHPVSLTAEQQQSVAEQRDMTNVTRRATVPELEEILFQPLPVLDHGFIRVVDYMGDDGAIVQAARVSYGHGTRKVREDAGLIRYLMRHWHSTPFEMCEIKLHIKLPIFVARQWIRHRTANVNEYSARYSILDKEFFVPDRHLIKDKKSKKKREQEYADQFHLFGEKPTVLKTIAGQSATNRQGRDEVLDDEAALRAQTLISDASNDAYSVYRKLLNEDKDGKPLDNSDQGLARELARVVLPVNYYTQWYWKIDLHNLMHFLRLRADPHAQHEIRAYADVLLDILGRWVPLTAAAFRDYRLEAETISRPGLAVVRRLLEGEAVEQETSGLSKREWRELMAALGREA